MGLYVKDRAKHRIFDTYGFVCLGPSETSTYGFVCLGPSETSDFWIHQTEDFWIHELVATCPVSSQVREILESRDLFLLRRRFRADADASCLLELENLPSLAINFDTAFTFLESSNAGHAAAFLINFPEQSASGSLYNSVYEVITCLQKLIATRCGVEPAQLAARAIRVRTC